MLKKKKKHVHELFSDDISFLQGMEYVGTRTGKRIASMSVGGGASVTMDNAVTGLYEAGVPVIVAAGNGNHDACDVSPARAEKVVLSS